MAVLHYLIESQGFLNGTRFDKYKKSTKNYSIFIRGGGDGGTVSTDLSVMIQRDFTKTGM